MNYSLFLGLILGVVVIIWAILAEMSNPAVFGNIHGIVIVLGGTLAAALVCFPFSHFWGLFRAFLRAVRGAAKQDAIDTIDQIGQLAQAQSEGRRLQDHLEGVTNSFLRESLELAIDGTFSQADLTDILHKRIEIQNEKYRAENATFKKIGKFPPAFGLIGATMGMIALLQGLGAPDAFERLGPSMSVALTATFWGLVFANLVLIPIGENLSGASDDDLIMRRIVVEGVLLLNERKHPLLIEEVLKSYLSPKERNKLKAAGR